MASLARLPNHESGVSSIPFITDLAPAGTAHGKISQADASARPTLIHRLFMALDPLRSSTKRVALFIFLLGAVASSPAQTVPVPPPSPSPNGDTVVLSPFTVTETEDTGYVATSSLAGTRIKTDLRDLAGSISV